MNAAKTQSPKDVQATPLGIPLVFMGVLIIPTTTTLGEAVVTHSLPQFTAWSDVWGVVYEAPSVLRGETKSFTRRGETQSFTRRGETQSFTRRGKKIHFDDCLLILPQQDSEIHLSGTFHCNNFNTHSLFTQLQV